MDDNSSSSRWCRAQGEIQGHDACRIEDLYVRGLDSDDAILFFALPPDMDRQNMTQAQAIEIILSQCREQGVT